MHAKVISPLLLLILFLSSASEKIGRLFPEQLSSSNVIHCALDSKSDFDKDYISLYQLSVDILHYDIGIELYPEDRIIVGEAVITGRVIQNPLPQIDLNFYDNFKIDSLTLNGKSVNYNYANNRLTIPLSETLDTFEVAVIYKGTPRRMGLSSFVFGEINGSSLVYTLNEPIYASTWFPCNDLPNDKAMLDISITNDSSSISVSNGKLMETQSVGSRKTYHWKTCYPIATYLICIYSAEYSHFNQYYVPNDLDTMSIDYYVLPEHLANAQNDFSEHPEMIRYFSDTFGEYPFIKEKYGVAEFLWQFGAMEHQTITGIGSNFVSGRNFFTDVLVHELAHQWWGNAVSPKTWNDIWLNEGFAAYSEALYAEFKGGAPALESVMISKYSRNFEGKLSEPAEDLFSKTIYDKGAWVLHMLRGEIGDSLFFNLLREYYQAFKYSNASTFDFEKFAEAKSGRSLHKFFDQWIYSSANQIELEYEYKIIKSEKGKYLLKLFLQQKQNDYLEYSFPIDVKIIFKDDSSASFKFYVDKRKTEVEMFVNQFPIKIVLDPEKWLLAKISKKR